MGLLRGISGAAISVLVSATLARAPGPSMSLGVGGRSNATPSIAAAGSFVAVAWSAAVPGGATDIYIATSRDRGQRFGSPVRVNDVPGDARVNGEQPPRIALGPAQDGEPAITVVWTTAGENGTKLVHARSIDGGRSFSRAANVPDTDAPGNRGWHNITVDRNGRVFVVWLDHRELARDPSMATSHHDHSRARPDGVAMAQKSKLYVASLDGTATAQIVTGGVCYCCKTALQTGGDGALYAAWRHVYPGNLRDIAFTTFPPAGGTASNGAGAFGTPVRVSEDQWRLEGCPDDGPAMAIDARNRVHLVWPTLVPGADGHEPTVGLFYAMSIDGRTFSARARIPTDGTPHHPQIAVTPDEKLAVAWDEGAAGARRVVVARGTVDASGSPHLRSLLSSGPGVYPALTAVDGTFVVVSTSAPGRVSQIGVSAVR